MTAAAHLTEAQRREMLRRAIDAVKALTALGPDADPGDVSRCSEIAQLAVTDAVTRGGHLHTQISGPAGVTGLRVIALIGDQPAQATALKVERNAIKNYTEMWRQAAVAHTKRRLREQGYGARAAVAREIGVTPVTVDAWAKEDTDSL
jgi:hypothetical protein